MLRLWTMLALVLAACQGAGEGAVEAIQARGELVCGVRYDLFAFSFVDPETGQLEGLDADLCREIAAAMGVDATFVEAASANRIPLLEEDQVDIVLSTLTADDPGADQVEFSDPYYLAGQSLLARADDASVQRLEDLAGRVVCAVEGPSTQRIRELAPDAEIARHATHADAAQALVDGGCDAVSADDAVLFGLADRFAGTELRGGRFTTTAYRIGVRDGAQDLVAFVNGVLRRLGESGRWEELYRQHIEPLTGEVPAPPFAVPGRSASGAPIPAPTATDAPVPASTAP
jgi:ABC-type amino acid transport substrate-binding protein